MLTPGISLLLYIITEYLFSFVFSEIRAAFSTAPLLGDICSSTGRDMFKEWLTEQYFADIIRRIDSTHFYFWLTYLYMHFHLQGRNNQILYSAFRRNGIQARLPYLDLMVGDFFNRMPQTWGRKIAFQSTKYPSTILARRYMSVPLHIVHGLDYRAFRGCNVFMAMMRNNRHLVETLRQCLALHGVDALPANGSFNLTRAGRIVERYVKKPHDVDEGHLYFLYGLACLNRRL